MGWRALLLVGLLAATACQGNGAPGSQSVQPKTGPPAEPVAESAPAPAPEPAGPPPRLRLTLSAGASSGLAVSLQNRDAKPVSLASSLTLERAKGDGFTVVEGAALSLRRDCAQPAGRCVTLAPGAELLPPPLRSAGSGGQCECTRCQPLPSGRYRVITRTCDGAFALTSDPFVLMQ